MRHVAAAAATSCTAQTPDPRYSLGAEEQQPQPAPTNPSAAHRDQEATREARAASVQVGATELAGVRAA